MTVQINDELTITTDHPLSSYGAGVLLASLAPDRAFGPADIYPNSAGGYSQSCAEHVLATIFGGATELPIEEDGQRQIKRWLSQHPNPAASERWPSNG